MNRKDIIGKLIAKPSLLDELSVELKEDRNIIKAFLEKLIFEGFVMELKDGRYKLIGDDIVLSMVKTRFKDVAYVTPIKKDMRDIRLVGMDARQLLKGDLVYVKIDDLYTNNGEGSLISILRPVTHIEGLVKKDSQGYYIESYKNIDSEVRFSIDKTDVELMEDQLVRGDILSRNDGECSIEVTDIICPLGDRMYELTKAIMEKDGLVSYPKDVIIEANSIFDYKDNNPKRKDLTKISVVTIDGSSTKDFDDGLSIERTSVGYDVGVHIADVASYVKEGTALDYEARSRSTSMYFPETEISMLPKLLSDDICSLNPNVDKLTITCMLHLNEQGVLLSSDVFLSKVRSIARLTYDQVDGYIDRIFDKFEGEVKETVDFLLECSQKILNAKREKGLLVFGRNYPEFTLDDKGEPNSVKPRHESEAENLVEVFMIMANDEVGKIMSKNNIPSLYRTEESPNREDMLLVRDFLYRFGIDSRLFPDDITSENLANYFKQLPDWAVTIGKLCTLKLMKPVVYSRTPSLHFGLNCNHYVYFTSPIRRYPDLLTHRLLHDFLIDSTSIDDKEIIGTYLDNLTDFLSQQERQAKVIMNNAHDMECERYMMNRDDEVMEAEVRNFIGGGIKIVLSNGISGLVPYDKIDGDYYKNYRMCFSIFGKNTDREIVLGDKLYVSLIDVVPESHTLIFATEEYLERGE